VDSLVQKPNYQNECKRNYSSHSKPVSGQKGEIILYVESMIKMNQPTS